MQPSMEACAWIHQAQDRSWRPYVMHTPDAAMRTSPSHVYYPWQVFFEGDFNRRRGFYIKAVLRKCYPICLEHQVFPRQATTVSQARWRNGNNFRGGATNRNLSREDYGRLLLLPLQDFLQAGREVSAPEGARQIQQGPQRDPAWRGD